MRIQFVAPAASGGITADRAARRITGRIVPFDEIATPSVGPRCAFAADGQHTPAADVWLNREHDPAQPLGKAITVEVRGDGVHGAFTILDTTAGTDALIEAAAGARSGLSIEADILAHEDRGDHILITRSVITEVALTRHPAFVGATTYDVAATAATDPQEGSTVDNQTVVAEPTDDQTPAPTDDQTQPAGPAPVAPVRATGITVAGAALPTPGEYLLASLSRDPARMADMSRRVRAAAPHTFVADIPGLIPTAIVAPVIHMRDGAAPVYNTFGPLQAPAGESFSLPVVDPELLAAEAANEKTDVTKQFKVTKVPVPMTFIKRAVNLSAEAVAWSQPSVIDVAVQELAESLAIGSDKAVAARLEAATGTNAAVTVAGDGSDAWGKLSGAVAAHYAACGAYPDRFVAAPDVWAKLAGMTNAVGAPIVAGVDQNLGGAFGSLFGVPVVVSPQITAGKAFLVSSRGVKSWTNGEVNMRVEEPTILGYALGAGRGVGLSIASGRFITPVTVLAAVAAAPAAS